MNGSNWPMNGQAAVCLDDIVLTYGNKIINDCSCMKDLRVIESVYAVVGSNFTPTFDTSIRFKTDDGTINELRVFFRITREVDSPLGVPQIRLFCGGRDHTLNGQKDEPVDGVLFSIKNPSALRELLLDLSAHLANIADHEFLSGPTETKE